MRPPSRSRDADPSRASSRAGLRGTRVVTDWIAPRPSRGSSERRAGRGSGGLRSDGGLRHGDGGGACRTRPRATGAARRSGSPRPSWKVSTWRRRSPRDRFFGGDRCGGHGSSGLRGGRPVGAARLGRDRPGPLWAAARSRGATQHRGDPAARARVAQGSRRSPISGARTVAPSARCSAVRAVAPRARPVRPRASGGGRREDRDLARGAPSCDPRLAVDARPLMLTVEGRRHRAGDELGAPSRRRPWAVRGHAR